jgi:class 3 adenylate cyclase
MFSIEKTVNTAARMESTGIPGRIHVSQMTADLLVEASKGKWIVPRGEVVHAKGKGYVCLIAPHQNHGHP